MKKIKLKYNLLVFLYVYLRQIDLSVDRSRWNLINESKHYYKSQINPLKVSSLLLQISCLELPENEIMLVAESSSFLKRLKRYTYQFVTRNYYLGEIEIQYCCQLLHRFARLLDSGTSSYGFENEKLRIDTAKFYHWFLEYKLWPKDFDRTMRIEHFLQHDDNSVTKMGEFVKDLEPEERNLLI